jgi:uncharacterized membrane protein HdeD (DUF308 family)
MSNDTIYQTTDDDRLVSAITDSVRANARLGAVSGFLLVVLGVMAIASPFVSGIAVSSLVAAIMVAAGMTTIFFCFKAQSFGRGLLQLLFGGITMLAGMVMIATPILTMVTLTAVLMAYFFVDGAFTVYSGFQRKPAEGWGWIVTSGVASIALGVLLAYQWPASGTYAVGLLVGIRLLFSGWSIAMLGMAADNLGENIGRIAEEVRVEFNEAPEATAQPTAAAA